MDIVLGGYFETAFVTSVDEIIRPERNRTPHRYYMCVNRKVAKSFFERASTFIAIADKVIVPQVDWAMPPVGGGPPELNSSRFGVVFSDVHQMGGREWDEDTVALARIIIRNKILSVDSWNHVSRIDLLNIDETYRSDIESDIDEIKVTIAEQYLCRIFLQLRATADSGSYLVISEYDIRLIHELGEFFKATRLPLPYAFPDLGGRFLPGDDFASGILNFAPPDAMSLGAVRGDPLVSRYARKVRSVITKASPDRVQDELLSAMNEAYKTSGIERRAEKVFEIASWFVKPLHYVPIVGNGLTIAEDLKDIVGNWLGRDAGAREWHLIGAKMADIAIKDYLARKGNQL